MNYEEERSSIQIHIFSFYCIFILKIMNHDKLLLSNSLTVGFDYFFTLKNLELVLSPFSVFRSRKYISFRLIPDFYYEPKLVMTLVPRAVLEPLLGLFYRSLSIAVLLRRS